MPRSSDGRWTATCEVCGKEFQQRRPGIRTCSFVCRARLPHNTGGSRPQADLETRACAICGNEFRPYRGGQETCSPECYRKSPPALAARERANIRRRTDEDAAARVREYNRRKWLELRYRMTVDEYEARLEAQGGVCMICHRPPNPNGVHASSRLHVDHDHATGVNRDLICTNCNRAIGYFKDDPALLRAAAEYIERHRAAVTASGNRRDR